MVALVALLAPSSSRGQSQSRIYRIGVLVPRSMVNFETRIDAFRDGMRELGYIEGRNITIDWRFADGDYDRLPMLANELVQSRPDVIVVDSTPAAKAMQRATTTIPIVIVSVGDPVGSGLVASLARPGGNITGLSNVVADVSAKYVELLRLAIPNLSRIVVLTNPDNLTHARIASQIESAAKTAGVSVMRVSARAPGDIDRAFDTIRQNRAGALVLLGDPFFGQQGKQVAVLALKHRIPTMQPNRALAEAGALMSYGQDLVEHYHRAATYVDRILKGAKPGDLPVEQSTKIELVVNLQTARALGLRIPQSLIVRADYVID